MADEHGGGDHSVAEKKIKKKASLAPASRQCNGGVTYSTKLTDVPRILISPLMVRALLS